MRDSDNSRVLDLSFDGSKFRPETVNGREGGVRSMKSRGQEVT